MYNSQASQSQITLVDHSTHGIPDTFISFIRDDVKNTKIYSAEERLLYTVETDKVSNTHTMVYRANTREVVASINRRNIVPDTVAFYDEPKAKLSKWLHGAKGKWSDFPAWFEWKSRKYTWKTSGRQIDLYEEFDSAPIAWFQTSRKEVIDGVPTFNRALVAIQDPAREILDVVVVSLLVVEQGLRQQETLFRQRDGGLPPLIMT